MNEKGGWDIYYLYIMSVYPTAKSSHTRRDTGFTWKKKKLSGCVYYFKRSHKKRYKRRHIGIPLYRVKKKKKS